MGGAGGDAGEAGEGGGDLRGNGNNDFVSSDGWGYYAGKKLTFSTETEWVKGVEGNGGRRNVWGGGGRGRTSLVRINFVVVGLARNLELQVPLRSTTES